MHLANKGDNVYIMQGPSATGCNRESAWRSTLVVKISAVSPNETEAFLRYSMKHGDPVNIFAYIHKRVGIISY